MTDLDAMVVSGLQNLRQLQAPDEWVYAEPWYAEAGKCRLVSCGFAVCGA